jgi:acetylornithine/succinyldiaminopimelate/putrescine aminotransferase
MRRLDAPALARDKGARLRAALEGVDGIESVRGQGLLLAAELSGGRESKEVYTALLADGLVTNAVTPTSLRLAPPLTVTDAEIDEAVAKIAKALV